LAASKPQVPNIGPAPKYFIGPTGYPGINIASEHKYMTILSSRALRVDFPGVPIHGMSLKEQLLLISIKRADARYGSSAAEYWYVASDKMGDLKYRAQILIAYPRSSYGHGTPPSVPLLHPAI
jgi:hypothetical protein